MQQICVKFIIFLIDEAIKTYVPLRKLKTNITYFSYDYLILGHIQTYQVQLTLSSTFDDMRCTLLRLLEKVKNLEA
ncbi:hypothetical protein Avbf_11197 [Armadillidium vulgare]|nr:hypothetical protein Avbf_11197 [Armadillidium vulgare]